LLSSNTAAICYEYLLIIGFKSVHETGIRRIGLPNADLAAFSLLVMPT